MNDELELLKRELNRELAELSAHLAVAGSGDSSEILNCGLELEGWLSRAQALGGAWQAETVSRAIAVGEGIRAGHSLANATERFMRLIIAASERLNEFAGDREALLSRGPGEWAVNA